MGYIMEKESSFKDAAQHYEQVSQREDGCFLVEVLIVLSGNQFIF